MTDFTQMERRLGGALDRMRAAFVAQAAARQKAQAHAVGLEAELMQARDAVAAAMTRPDPDADAPDTEAALEAALSEAEAHRQAAAEAQSDAAALRADLSATQAEAERLRGLLEAADQSGTDPDAPDASDAVGALQAELTELRGQHEAAQAEAAALRAELEGSRIGAGDTGPSEDVQARLSDIQADRDAARSEADSLRARLAAQEGRDRLQTAQATGAAETLQSRVTQIEAALTGLRQVNAQLRQNNAALREAHAAGLPDADLINTGLQAEIDALQAARSADRAEIDSVLAALRPLLEGETADA